MALMMCVTFAACSGGAPEGGESGESEEDSYGYAVEDMEVGSNIGSFVSEDLDGNEVTRSSRKPMSPFLMCGRPSAVRVSRRCLTCRLCLRNSLIKPR